MKLSKSIIAVIIAVIIAATFSSKAFAGVDDISNVADGCQVVGALVSAFTGNRAFQSAGSGCADLANLTIRAKCRRGDDSCYGSNQAARSGGYRSSGRYSSTRSAGVSGYRTAPGTILGPSSRGRAPQR